MIAKLSKVQWLTIEELAELWARELGHPKSIVVRELRLALYKLQKSGMALNSQTLVYEKFREQLLDCPEDRELPALSTKVDRKFIRAFCDKETWYLPSFWFEKKTNEPSFPGRPSIMAAILSELKIIASGDGLKPTLAEQARVLRGWTKENFPADQIPTARTIENGIRSKYNQLKTGKGKSMK